MTNQLDGAPIKSWGIRTASAAVSGWDVRDGRLLKKPGEQQVAAVFSLTNSSNAVFSVCASPAYRLQTFGLSFGQAEAIRRSSLFCGTLLVLPAYAASSGLECAEFCL